MINFNLATREYQEVSGTFYPAVVEICTKVERFQLEIGKLQDAMDNFLESLMIIRASFGNKYLK